MRHRRRDERVGDSLLTLCESTWRTSTRRSAATPAQRPPSSPANPPAGVPTVSRAERPGPPRSRARPPARRRRPTAPAVAARPARSKPARRPATACSRRARGPASRPARRDGSRSRALPPGGRPWRRCPPLLRAAGCDLLECDEIASRRPLRHLASGARLTSVDCRLSEGDCKRPRGNASRRETARPALNVSSTA